MHISNKVMQVWPSQEVTTMKAPLLLRLFCRSPFTLRLMLLEMLTTPQKPENKAS
ncbi:hypothetical protein J2125_003720 [Erwinia toletana]|uniref:Uncharacterized protein n=1 Tax=Winslowiella toletana TaxID=92490 RepID=A0ABS4PD14_9GAMM|nr:hypothetical protein [Winslowiella toletana]MBP2170528.1 hypothetical protein [Winslowiella toletana]